MVLATPAVGQEAQPGNLAAWGTSLPLDQRIGRELQRFGGSEPLDREYIQDLPREIRSRVFGSADTWVAELLTGRCNPFLTVSIGETQFEGLLNPSVAGDLVERSQDFEGSLVRTEMVACLETGLASPDEALEIYVSPEFRMAAESRIESMWESPEGSCFETKGMYGLVDPTRVCNRIEEYRAAGVAAQHSQVVFNEGLDPYQPVFFKESLKAFVKIPGGLALYYINFTRTRNLGRLQRWVASGQIRGAQEKNLRALKRRVEG